MRQRPVICLQNRLGQGPTSAISNSMSLSHRMFELPTGCKYMLVRPDSHQFCFHRKVSWSQLADD